MTKKTILLYTLCGICFIMPIISVEEIIPWIIAVFFICRSLKQFKDESNIKLVLLNTIFCGVSILLFNIIARNIESILVKMLM